MTDQRGFQEIQFPILYSPGDCDGWWWRSIAQMIRGGRSELIIYRRQDSDGHTIDSVKDRFLGAGGI